LEAVLDLRFVASVLPTAGVMGGLGMVAWSGIPDPVR
jgi:hypothetical protein